MRNKFKAKLRAKNELFKTNLEILTNFFNGKYPGWQETKDSDHIKKRLNQTAQEITKNKMKKKIKLLKKSDFKNWPFVDDQVILVQTSKKMISVIINMQEYAINGLAATALNLKFAHDAGKARVGKSISEFIELGMKL